MIVLANPAPDTGMLTYEDLSLPTSNKIVPMPVAESEIETT